MMVAVKSVKIDGQDIHIFNSAIYIFESSSGTSLELDMIVSEVTVLKYNKEENLIVEIELEDGRIINSIMHLKVFAGGLPQLNLYFDLDDVDEYKDFDIVTENGTSFPSIEEGITLEKIRKVEMPDQDIRLKLKLPIDQVEWLQKLKKRELEELLKEMIYEYWRNEGK